MNNKLTTSNKQQAKYTRLAYEVKNIVKTGYSDRIFLNIQKELISQESFQGWNEIIFKDQILDYCMKYDLSLDSDRLIDLIISHIKGIERLN